MAENMNAKEIHQRIRELITSMVELGEMNIVHEDGHISWSSSPTEPIIAPDPKGKRDPGVLCVYMVDCKIPNAVILNPLTETVGEISNDKKWFYANTLMKYSCTVTKVINLLLDTAVAANSGTLTLTDPHFIHALEGIVKYVDDKSSKEFGILNGKMRKYDDELDEKMLEEFQLINQSDVKDFVTLTYNKLSRTASVVTCFQDPEEKFKKQFGTRIRKKTWVLLETLFKELFACEDLSKSPIIVQAKDLKCPQFKTWVEALMKGWSMLLPYLPHIYGDESAEKAAQSIVFVESCLPHINRFAEKAAWIGSGTMGSISLNDGSMVSKNDTTSQRYVPLSPGEFDDDRAPRKGREDRDYDRDQPRGRVESDDPNRPKSTLELLRESRGGSRNGRDGRDRGYFDDDDDRDRSRGRRDYYRGRDDDRGRRRPSRDDIPSTLELAREQKERRRASSSRW